jgi:type VI secretion system secreted protein VgrG
MALPGLSPTDAILTIKVDEGGFLVLGMTGFEHLGQMFEYTVELAGSLNLLGSANEVDLHKLVGTRATLKMVTDSEGEDRLWDGFIVRAKRGEMKGRYPTFKITLKPWLWFATQRKNSKVFQEKNVKTIIDEVLADYPGATKSWKLDDESQYKPLDYCIQHNETDFDFISRLIEEVGIYYYFEHKPGEHMLVFTNATGKHEKLKVNRTITWRNAMQSAPTITRWHVQEEVRAIKTVLTEYDYLDPQAAIKGEHDFKDKIGEPFGKMEWFEHPGLVVQNGAEEEKKDAASDITKRAEVRMEELTGLFSVSTGLTNVQDFTVGGIFKLEGASDDDNQEYLIVSTVYRAEFNDHASITDLRSERRREGFRCEFMCQSVSKAPNYRSPRITPKPVIAGLQTAIVVGDSGKEIETDIHGRIKIHFPWDRDGPKTRDSSCWVRVAQPWAGKQFGMFGLPRVGHEVIVQFLNGDPDKPIVTGSVYNKDNMPPWKLPAHQTVSGVKTQSSNGSASLDHANELRFDDKDGKEYVWFQAQKDFHRLVRNDAFDYVGHNESVKVVLTRNEVIGENWFLDVTKDVMHNLGKDLHVNVAGDIFYTGAATYQMKIDKDVSGKIGGDLGLDVGGKTQLKSMGDIVLQSATGKLSLKAGDTGDMLAEAMTIKIKGAMTVALEGSVGVSLKCGGSFVSVGPAGVDISGPLVKINSGGSGAAASAALKASPAVPADAKKEELLTDARKTEYEQPFKDPLPHQEGGSNGPPAP